MCKEKKKFHHVCVCCGKEFYSLSWRSKYCSYSCSKKAFNERNRKERFESLIKNGIEGIDYVIDRWNNLPTPRIYGVWMKQMHPDKTLDDYKKEFPDAPLYCLNDYKRTTEHTGEWMKKDEYKKMYSERMKGEKNHRHHSKISSQEARESSPFSKEFYIKRGLDLKERDDLMEKIKKKRVSAVSLQYFLNMGLSEEDARIAQSERNRTFTLEKCIKKYGDVEGKKIFDERQRKWVEKMKSLYKEGKFSTMPKTLLTHLYSEIEIDFVEMLCEKMNIDINSVRSALSKGGQLTLKGNKQLKYSYDFCLDKKIIEFNGDFWHANPKIYNKDSYITKNKTARDIWEKDLDKINSAKEYGYDVMVVWESDYRNDKNDVIEKCVKYLTD